jgi:hypothetical protein
MSPGTMAPLAPAPVASPEAAPAHARHTGCGCRYCSATLPESRAVSFCPHCGQNLTVRQCPACSAELDLGWRFCVCCGRSVAEG